MTGERDLKKLLASMKPVLDPQDYVFVTTTPNRRTSDAPLMRFSEAEGDTLVLPAEAAAAEGFSTDRLFRRITLNVHSDLEAVGLTAAVATCLTEHDISANVVAAFFHDHVFVPAKDADGALAALRGLSSRSA